MNKYRIHKSIHTSRYQMCYINTLFYETAVLRTFSHSIMWMDGVCVCMFACVWVSVCEHTCMCLHVGARCCLQKSSTASLSLSNEAGSLRSNWTLRCSLSGQPACSTTSLCPQPGHWTQGRCSHPASIYGSSGDHTFSPHTWVTRALSTKLSPHPMHQGFLLNPFQLFIP